MHHHMHRIQKFFRRHIRRRNEAPTWLKILGSRSVVPIKLVFILLARQNLASIVVQADSPVFTFSRFFLSTSRRSGGRGQGAGEVW